MSPTPFKFALSQRLTIACSDEDGTCIARSEHAHSEPQYLLRYMAADGRAAEAWWGESALNPLPCSPHYLGDDTLTGGLAIKVETTHGINPEGPPPIGNVWAAQGGVYAGVSRGVDGKPDHHLILATQKPAQTLSWDHAGIWARQLTVGNHRDWALPTRAESALLFANLQGEFESAWHWTSEAHADGSCAWLQDFDDGYQYYYHKSYEGRARAVRRLVLQSFGA